MFCQNVELKFDIVDLFVGRRGVDVSPDEGGRQSAWATARPKGGFRFERRTQRGRGESREEELIECDGGAEIFGVFDEVAISEDGVRRGVDAEEIVAPIFVALEFGEAVKKAASHSVIGIGPDCGSSEGGAPCGRLRRDACEVQDVGDK